MSHLPMPSSLKESNILKQHLLMIGDPVPWKWSVITRGNHRHVRKLNAFNSIYKSHPQKI
ncbi:hypothetical protein CFP56_041430 [Quercus suber]|uniref:Uncharacterized protein n=1 Tax=Quercus suber TaxID=58331 RepID=A0AAW0LJW8_QUESU